MEKENKEFENNIRYSLGKLSQEQRGKFSWLCAVRALPFLSGKRNFDYWEKKSRQKLLFSIFWCIDTSADVYRLRYIGKAFDAAYAYNAADIAADTATTATAAAVASS
jgi:hypothetical protein